MKNHKGIGYTRIVALKEKASGNETVGTNWIETKTFDKSTPISDIVDWAHDCDGRLIIAIDEDSIFDLPY